MTDQRCAVVTGASRGIGSAVAKGLADAGYTVVGTATGKTGLRLIESELCANYPACIALELNVAQDDSIEQFLSNLEAHKLKPLVLVNNAGITRDNLLLRMKDDEWNEVLTTNLSSIFKLSKPLLRNMLKARTGRIINIGSVVGSAGNAGQANYAASKAGMVGLTKSLAREVAIRGITVNTIAPGFIDTDMTKAVAPQQREMMLAQVPAGRLGDPDEIASAVVFLASDAAGYITGETLHINGGMHMD